MPSTGVICIYLLLLICFLFQLYAIPPYWSFSRSMIFSRFFCTTIVQILLTYSKWFWFRVHVSASCRRVENTYLRSKIFKCRDKLWLLKVTLIELNPFLLFQYDILFLLHCSLMMMPWYWYWCILYILLWLLLQN